MTDRKWMLPEGVEELLPPLTWQLETLRRKLLDDYRRRHYELVHPPLIEHLDALLTGTAQGLEQQTLKLTDPASGRLLGVRADITPQAARIAARHFADAEVVRLCYLGSVLRAQADGLGGARALRQVGCELFGVKGIDGDVEALDMMLRTLNIAGIKKPTLDLGHVGIYRALVARLKLDAQAESTLFGILQRKSHPDLALFFRDAGVRPSASAPIRALLDLNGDASVVAAARTALNSVGGAAGSAVEGALDQLNQVLATLQSLAPKVPLHVDLAELRGYRYHTGVVFAAYVPQHGREIARGGRYDGVGADFGATHAATGFSADLNELLRLGAA